MSNESIFREGDNVVLRSTREMGRIERPPTLDGGEYWYRVRFVRRVDNVVEDDLDPLDEVDESLEQLAANARWGRIQAFRTALAVERITHTKRHRLSEFIEFHGRRNLYWKPTAPPLKQLSADS